MRAYNPIKDCYWLGMKQRLYAGTYKTAQQKRIKRVLWLMFTYERERMANHYLRSI